MRVETVERRWGVLPWGQVPASAGQDHVPGPTGADRDPVPSGRRHSAQGDVCCVCPGFLEQEDRAEGDGEEFLLELFRSVVPLKRMIS